MRVSINNLPADLIRGEDGPFEAVSVSMAPDGRYAVVEAVREALFVAVNVISCEDGVLVGDFVNYCWTSAPDIPMMYSINTDWSYIGEGYCKLVLFAPEMVNEFGGRFDKTISRFYFDWELYKKCYEKRHGIPCDKPDPNKRGEQ